MMELTIIAIPAKLSNLTDFSKSLPTNKLRLLTKTPQTIAPTHLLNQGKMRMKLKAKNFLKQIHQLEISKFPTCSKKLLSKNQRNILTQNKKETTLLSNTKSNIRLKCARIGNYLENVNSRTSAPSLMEKVNF